MATVRASMPSNSRILVVTLRRIGDVLLTTPLIRSIRRAWPDATIDALVFEDTAGILVGNPDVNSVIALPSEPTLLETMRVAVKLIRRYDLAVSTQSGDRPTGFAILAGNTRVAPVEDRLGGWMKATLIQRSVATDARAHRVEAMLQIADVLGIPRFPEVIPPCADVELPATPYAVVHAAPFYHYKRWTIAGWRAVADALAAENLMVIASGGPSSPERAYLDEVWRRTSVMRRDGRLGWGELAGLLAKASVYVGPDTSVTHLAAATGCPTIALYGPTDPQIWGPWPAGGLGAPWDVARIRQRRGNVWLVQHAFPCTPCQLEGCDRRLSSDSACLNELAPGAVIEAAREALNSR